MPLCRGRGVGVGERGPGPSQHLTVSFSTLSARGQKQKSVIASVLSVSNIFGHHFDKMVVCDFLAWDCGFRTLFVD